LNKQGNLYGLIKVHLYRPWSHKHFLKSLPSTVTHLCVLDRTKESGSLGEPLYLDIVATCQEYLDRPIYVIGGRYGLGSKDFNPQMVQACFDNLRAPKPKNHFTVGIVDDVTHTSLTLGLPLNTVPTGTTECMFWGMGSDGTVSANQNAIKMIAQKN
jgi:pyruvate-ferredoxin/flavodoxin oxidoreductase